MKSPRPRLHIAPLAFVLLVARAAFAGEPPGPTVPAPGPTVPVPPVAPAAVLAPPGPTLPLAPPAPPPPTDARTALDRARAAYEYGDIAQVLEASRLVTEGVLPATALERTQAWRLHGIALYLVGRTQGAESAFFELLRLNPGARLDATVTRPDVVAFFEQVRRRHQAEIKASARASKSLFWCFVPPVGQLQNGNPKRAVVYGALEGVTLIGAVTTWALGKAWQQDHYLYGDHTETVKALKTWNKVSVGLFATTYVVGVLDALLSFGDVKDVERQ